MSVPFSNTNLRIPHGFGNMLEGLTREVLRKQPDNIPLFAAEYFAQLLQQREESGIDPAEWGAKLQDRFYNNHIFEQSNVSDFEEPDPEEQAAIKIQATYRGYAARQEVKKLKANKDVLPASPVNLTFAEQPASSSMEDVFPQGYETRKLKEEKIDIWKRPSTSALSEQSQENSTSSYSENIVPMRLEQDFDRNDGSIVRADVTDPETKATDFLEMECNGTADVDANAMELSQQDIHEITQTAATNTDIRVTVTESTSEGIPSQNDTVTQEAIQEKIATSSDGISSTERAEENVQENSQTNAPLLEDSAMEVNQEDTSEGDHVEASVDVSTDEEPEPEITTLEAAIVAVEIKASNTNASDEENDLEQSKDQEVQEMAEEDEDTQGNAPSIDPESVKETRTIADDDKMELGAEEEEDHYETIHSEPHEETEVGSAEHEDQVVEKETTVTEAHTTTTEQSFTTDQLVNPDGEKLKSDQADVTLQEDELEEKQYEEESARETVRDDDA